MTDRFVTSSRSLSRLNMLGAVAGAALAASARGAPLSALADTVPVRSTLFAALDDKIEAAMARYHIPGVAVGVLYDGQEYVRGYGMTNADYPVAVDGETLFRIGSVTKTFTGTTIVALAQQGKIDIDAPVRTYLPELKLADPSVAAHVTVRQLLNHSAGWMGDDYASFGQGNDALAQYVAAMQYLPQLTALGQVLAYNNAAVNLAGRVIEVVTQSPYEAAVQKLVLDSLALKHSGFFTDKLVGYNIAASHVVKDGNAAVDPTAWAFPRSLNATGGLISSARDQLRFLRFHLGSAMAAMRANPGPGGTLTMEVDGVCVTWWQRRTAEGIPVFQHMGSWGGQNSDVFFVPQRGFAMVILTNSTAGPMLIAEVDRSGWALKHFAGLNDPPAPTKTLSAAQLAPYEGRYRGWIVPPDGTPRKISELAVELRASNGGLVATGDLEVSLAFYRDDFVLTTDADGLVKRSDFIRGADGSVAWLRDGGRIFARQA